MYFKEGFWRSMCTFKLKTVSSADPCWDAQLREYHSLLDLADLRAPLGRATRLLQHAPPAYL